jgi:protein-S-isoprenylcysteine O-methyltransferase Ste14
MSHPNQTRAIDGPISRPRLPGFLDVSERVLAVALYGWLIARVMSVYLASGGAGNLIVLVSEGLVIFFMLIRRGAQDVSQRPIDWLLTLLATTMPLLVQPMTDDAILPPAIGAAMMLAGIAIQLVAKITLGRSFGWAPAHRGLKLSGPYRFVRHPIYAGYLLCHVAFLLLNWTVWNAAVYALCYMAQVPRLLAEERLLRRDERYVRYMSVVRFRLLPGVF